MSSSRSRPWLRWVIAAGAVVVVLAVAGPFIFFHFVEGNAPAALSLNSTASATPASAGPSQGAGQPLAGGWTVGSGSQVGYRVKEILAGQSHTAVGRTSSVTGHLAITGTTVRTGTFTVRMSTIHSDSSQRDAQFDGRIMDVATYPASTFTLTRPIDLAPLPATGAIKTYSAAGSLVLHGHTRPVSFPLTAERTPTGIKVSGSIPVTFAKWDIPNPSFTGFVTTQNHGVLEFLLTFQRA